MHTVGANEAYRKAWMHTVGAKGAESDPRGGVNNQG